MPISVPMAAGGFHVRADVPLTATSTPQGYMAISTVSLVFMILAFVPIAWGASSFLEDGACKVIQIGTVGLMAWAIPGFLLINTRTTAWAVVAQIPFCLGVACIGAGLPFLMVDTFPTSVRVAGVGIAYNVAQAIFGGTAPVINTALAQAHPVLPCMWTIVVGLISSLCLRQLKVLRQERSFQAGPSPIFETASSLAPAAAAATALR